MKSRQEKLNELSKSMFAMISKFIDTTNKRLDRLEKQVWTKNE